VREVAVTAREDKPGDLRLVAYVVPEGGDLGLAELLRAHAAERLPAYLVPAAFVILPALPLSANGKLDRRALPAPEWQSAATHVPPRTPVENVLADLWCQVLGCEKVGVTDDFFRLGGHSLLATRLIARVRGTFRVAVPVRQLFEKPTVETLAKEVLRAEEKPGQSDRIARAILRLRSSGRPKRSAPNEPETPPI
jgi:acyl carrier protein